MKKQQAEPEFTVDTDGLEIAHVALANSQQRATLYADHFRRLTAAGFPRYWQYMLDGRGNAYPAVGAYTPNGKSHSVPIARLIVSAGRGQRVRYADGNSLNLRMENLEVYSGYAQHDACDWYPTVTALRVAGFEPAKDTRAHGRKRQQTSRGTPRGKRHQPATEHRPIDRESQLVA